MRLSFHPCNPPQWRLNSSTESPEGHTNHSTTYHCFGSRNWLNIWRHKTRGRSHEFHWGWHLCYYSNKAALWDTGMIYWASFRTTVGDAAARLQGFLTNTALPIAREWCHSSNQNPQDGSLKGKTEVTTLMITANESFSTILLLGPGRSCFPELEIILAKWRKVSTGEQNDLIRVLGARDAPDHSELLCHWVKRTCRRLGDGDSNERT